MLFCFLLLHTRMVRFPRSEFRVPAQFEARWRRIQAGASATLPPPTSTATTTTMEEGELGPTNGVDAGAGRDELYNALHQRLVASGEWQRLLILLKRMLDECGWEAQFQSTATTKAKQQPVLDVPSLIDALTPHAKGRHLPHTASSQELLLTVFVRAIRHAATPRQGASAREAPRLFGPKPRRCLVAPPHPISYPYPARLPSGAQCKTQQSADQRVLTRARPTQKQKGQHAKRSRGAARADSRSSTSLAPPSRCLPSDTPGPLVDSPKRTTQRQPKLRAEMVGLPTLRLTSACNASCHGTMGEEGVSAGLNANVV